MVGVPLAPGLDGQPICTDEYGVVDFVEGTDDGQPARQQFVGGQFAQRRDRVGQRDDVLILMRMMGLRVNQDGPR